MEGNSGNGLIPKFFKVYLAGESGDHLEIPISFNRFLPKNLPRSVTVRSTYGKMWKLSLRKCSGGDEKYALVNGWKRIAKDEGLNAGDFLELEFDGSMCFNFCIYEGATMTKRLTRSSMHDNNINTDSDGEEEEEESGGSDDVVVLDDDDDDTDDADYNCDADDDYLDDNGVEDSAAEAVDDDVEAVDDDETNGDDERQYLDDRENPYFTMALNPKKISQLHIPARVIKDYGLNFPESITVIDPLSRNFGKLVKKVKIQKNGCVFIKGFGSVIRRNEVKTTDKMIFEIKKTGGSNLVHTIKVYIITG